jgi:hypothetical protein
MVGKRILQIELLFRKANHHHATSGYPCISPGNRVGAVVPSGPAALVKMLKIAPPTF